MNDDRHDDGQMRFDLLVVGGTLEGCIAAVVAARSGYKVVLIENSGSLGGLATNGLHSWFPALDSQLGDTTVNQIRNELLERLEIAIAGDAREHGVLQFGGCGDERQQPYQRLRAWGRQESGGKE